MLQRNGFLHVVLVILTGCVQHPVFLTGQLSPGDVPAYPPLGALLYPPQQKVPIHQDMPANQDARPIQEAQPIQQNMPAYPQEQPTLNAGSLDSITKDQTTEIQEEQDRINRFRHLAYLQGITTPEVEQILLPPGSVDFMPGRSIPVVRVVFPERAFFASNSATPLPSAEPIFNVIAENMKHDEPDSALTVLGHTDAMGTDAYNIDLSRRRAEAVMMSLLARGVNSTQLSEVAIGKRQPIAPNNTSDGRARNRRVEFMISPALMANLTAIQQRVVTKSYFQTGDSAPRDPASVAQVYRLAPTQHDTSELSKIGGLTLSPPNQGAALIQPKTVVPLQLIPPVEVTPRQLGTNPAPY